MVTTDTASLSRTSPGGGPSEKRIWLAVVTLALGAFVLVASEFLPVGIVPIVAADLDLSLGSAGLMILVPGLVAAIAAPLIVVGSGRMRRNHLVLLLGVLLVISNIVAAVAPDYTVLLAARVLLGISLGGFWAVVPSLSFRLVREGLGARATSLILTGISAGTVAGLPAGQLLGDLFGWRWVFGGAAVVALVILVIQFFVIPHIAATDGLTFRHLLDVFRSRVARLGLIVTVPIIVGQFAALTFIRPFFEDEVRADPQFITLLLLAFGAAGILGTLIGGSLVTRSNVATLAGVAAVLGAVLILLPLASGSTIAAGALFIAWGVLWGMIPLALQTWMISALPAAPEAASAVHLSTLQLSIAAGSLLGGALVDTAGLHVNLWIAGAVMAAAGIVVALAGSRRR
jgi:predicted MFS family arabinose efflux permease